MGFKESEIACNLQALAQNCLEPLRAKFGAFNINSGFRLGEKQSQHGKGEAADIQWIGKDRKFLLDACIWASQNLSYDQIIYEVPEPGSGNPYTQSAWMHISFNRKGNRSASNPSKNMTYRGYGNTYYPQSQINWTNIKFASDSRPIFA
jgi:hypothetical protein